MSLTPAAGRVALARFISRTGGEAAFFVGVWGKAAYDLDAQPSGIATLVAVMGIAALVGSGIAGPLIDRFGPGRVLIASELAFVPTTISAVFADDLTSLILVAGGIGLFSAPTYTAITSFPPFLTRSEQELGRINGWVETAGMAALISGSALGAVMAVTVGIDAIFWFDAATSLVALALVMGIKTGSSAPHPADQPGWADASRGFRTVYSSRRLRYYVLAATAVWTAFGFFGALEPLFFRDVLEVGPETLGVINTIFGVGLLGGTLAIRRLPDALRGARGVALFTGLNGVGALIYVGTARLPVVMTGAMVWGVIVGVMAPLTRTMIHLNSPAGQVGRVMGVTQMHAEVAKLAPLTLAPILAGLWGIQTALLASGMTVSVLAVLMIRTATWLDKTRDVPVPPLDRVRTSDEPFTTNR